MSQLTGSCESHLTALNSYVMLIYEADWIIEMAACELKILSNNLNNGNVFLTQKQNKTKTKAKTSYQTLH